MGPVVFSNSGIALDTSFAALFLGRRREYPLPKKLLLIKPKPPAPPTPLSANSPAPTPNSAPAPDSTSAPDPASAPGTAPAPDSAPVPDPSPAPPTEPDAAPPPAEVIPTPWTEIQDAMLRGLKDYQNKSWREIGALIEGRDSEECRERYDELEAIVIAEKKVKEEEEEKIKKGEEQAMEEAEIRTWWAIHKGEKAKAAESGQKAKEQEAKKEESMAVEKAKSEGAKKEVTLAEKVKREEIKKQAKATRADKRAKDKEAKKEESDTAADANPNEDKKGKKDKTKGKDKTTSCGKKTGKDREARAKNLPHFNDTNATTKTTIADRPIINLDGLDEEEIEEAPLLWSLHSQSEAQKWNEMSSRYFEATGQQVPAKVLEKKLKSLGM